MININTMIILVEPVLVRIHILLMGMMIIDRIHLTGVMILIILWKYS